MDNPTPEQAMAQVDAVGEQLTAMRAGAAAAGLSLELDDDGHPDADFRDHTFYDDDVEFELALRQYAAGSPADARIHDVDIARQEAHLDAVYRDWPGSEEGDFRA